MKEYDSTISEALQSIELINNTVTLRGELRTHNAFYFHGIFYAELFDGKTTLRIAFAPQNVEIPPDVDCSIEVEGEIQIYANKAGLTLWVERWRLIGDSQLQSDVEWSYEILDRYGKKRKKRSLPKKIQKVLLIGPKTDSAHAIQDFINGLRKYSAGESVELTVRQVRMRGDDAAAEIATEIHKLNRRKDVDVYCLVSGGGDKYELNQVFSAPVLVEAVCSSKLPCLVGLGHSKDDFPLNEAAYRYADTPSAAGAMLGELIREKRGKGCYIVTATCGANSPEVRLFYELRDNYLAKNFLGRLVIRGYYFVSPSLATLLSENSLLKMFSYRFVIHPLYKVLSRVLGDTKY